ncbi:phytochrome-like protein cph1 [mine drainage metagenome]|uniref:histidine kinase n=1 Tax=mine drainage metagenome TaxID=410659 RepID=A0A1J5RK50_9ZZZZ
MNGRHVAAVVLLVLGVGAGANGLALSRLRGQLEREHGLDMAMTRLADAETGLDADMLRVSSLQMQEYDGVVRTTHRLEAARRGLQEPLRAVGDAGLERAAQAYGDVLTVKMGLMEALKSTCAVLRNQIAYVPFAVERIIARDHPPPGMARRLSALASQMLVYHITGAAPAGVRLLALLEAVQTGAAGSEVAALTGQVRVYARQRAELERLMQAYDQSGSGPRLEQWRRLFAARHERTETRIMWVGTSLTLFCIALLAALGASMLQQGRARAAAQAATRHLTDAVETMQGALALYDHDRRLVLCNRQCLTFFPPLAGHMRPGALFDDLVRELDRSAFLKEPVEQLTALNKPSWVQHTADGRSYLFSHARLADGGFLRLATDITEQKKAEAELLRLFTAVEQSPAAILITDVSGAIQYVNPWFCRVSGYEAGEVMGQSPRILKSGLVADAVYGELWRTISGGAVWTGELCNRRKNGELYWEAVSISPVRNDQGEIISYVGVKSDITEQKRQADRQRQVVLELERSNAELEQFAYVVSHDLREPLRMVSSYVSLLARRYGERLDAEAMEFIAFAKDGARRMDKLILDLLDYSRIGRVSQPFEPVAMDEVLREALLNLDAVIDLAGARVQVEKDLPAVMGSRSELVRLLQNLLGNAIKYRAPDRRPEIAVSAWEADGQWYFEVRDNGIGIAADYAERVFGIFQRLHARDEYEGTGIGLAVCRKIVHHHGGRIWLETSPSAAPGCRFRFTLPAGLQDVAPAAEKV